MLLTGEGDARLAFTKHSPPPWHEFSFNFIEPKTLTKASVVVRKASYLWGFLRLAASLWDSILMWVSP
jgi:hypothetical protein